MLTETYCNKVNIQITQRDDFILIAVCSQIRTKHINTLCGQNVESLNGKLVAHIATTGLIWLTQFQSLLQQLSDN